MDMRSRPGSRFVEYQGQSGTDMLLPFTTTSYFYPGIETELIVDASSIGLGAIVCQQDTKGVKHITAYASRSLSDAGRCSDRKGSTGHCVELQALSTKHLWSSFDTCGRPQSTRDYTEQSQAKTTALELRNGALGSSHITSRWSTERENSHV